MQRLIVARAAIALLVLGAGAAGAKPGDGGRASWLARQAEQLMAAGKAELACPKLAESQQLEPRTSTLHRLAQCYETTGNTEAAQASYRALAAEATKSGDGELAQIARDKLGAADSSSGAEPLKQIGDTSWNDGVGLVRAPEPSEAPQAGGGVGTVCAAEQAVDRCIVAVEQAAETAGCGRLATLQQCVQAAADEASDAAGTTSTTRLKEAASTLAASLSPQQCEAAVAAIIARLRSKLTCRADGTTAGDGEASAASASDGEVGGDGQPTKLPVIEDTDWSRFRAGVGLVGSYFTPSAGEFFAMQVWGLLGYEHRQRTSVWAPWVEGSVLLGPAFEGTETGETGGAITLSAHLGVDFYLPGWRWGAFGPFVGFAPKLLPGFEDGADFRADWLGAKVRAFSSPDLPGVEAELKFFLRASSAEPVAPYAGFFLSAGESLRVMAFADVRFTEPARTPMVADAVAERVRFGLGALWF